MPTLPLGLKLTMALLRPIDLRSAAAGDQVSAKVTGSVRASGSKEVLVPAEAIAR